MKAIYLMVFSLVLMSFLDDITIFATGQLTNVDEDNNSTISEMISTKSRSSHRTKFTVNKTSTEKTTRTKAPKSTIQKITKTTTQKTTKEKTTKPVNVRTKNTTKTARVE